MTDRRCPDDGACHHDCGDGGCYRVSACGPLSGVYPDDTWPTEVIEHELRATIAVLRGAPEVIDADHLARQREWSEATFGPGSRAQGVIDHIRKELVEIEADPTDLGEWVDVVILALDGAWRAGHEPQAIIDAIKAKQARNEAREWPDWRTASEDGAIEHLPTLHEAVKKVAEEDWGQEGFTAVQVLDRINERWPGRWPLITHLDIYDILRDLLGSPSRG